MRVVLRINFGSRRLSGCLLLILLKRGPLPRVPNRRFPSGLSLQIGSCERGAVLSRVVGADVAEDLGIAGGDIQAFPALGWDVAHVWEASGVLEVGDACIIDHQVGLVGRLSIRQVLLVDHIGIVYFLQFPLCGRSRPSLLLPHLSRVGPHRCALFERSFHRGKGNV